MVKVHNVVKWNSVNFWGIIRGLSFEEVLRSVIWYNRQASGIPRTTPPSRAGPYLGFEALHISKNYPLVTLEGVGHLLVLDSVFSGSLLVVGL